MKQRFIKFHFLFRDPDAPPLPPPRPKQKGENAGKDDLLLDYEFFVLIYDRILDPGFSIEIRTTSVLKEFCEAKISTQ